MSRLEHAFRRDIVLLVVWVDHEMSAALISAMWRLTGSEDYMDMCAQLKTMKNDVLAVKLGVFLDALHVYRSQHDKDFVHIGKLNVMKTVFDTFEEYKIGVFDTFEEYKSETPRSVHSAILSRRASAFGGKSSEVR